VEASIRERNMRAASASVLKRKLREVLPLYSPDVVLEDWTRGWSFLGLSGLKGFFSYWPDHIGRHAVEIISVESENDSKVTVKFIRRGREIRRGILLRDGSSIKPRYQPVELHFTTNLEFDSDGMIVRSMTSFVMKD